MAKQAKRSDRGAYTNDEKKAYVQRIENGEVTVAQVAAEVGYSTQAIHGWVNTFGKDAVNPRTGQANGASNQATANATRRAGGARRGAGRPKGSKNKPTPDNAPRMRAAAKATGPEETVTQEAPAPRQTRASANIMENPNVIRAERDFLRAIVEAAGIAPV